MTRESTKVWLDHCDAHERAMGIIAVAYESCRKCMAGAHEGTTAWRRAVSGVETNSRIMSHLMQSSQQVLDGINRREREAARVAVVG